ncbi:MAG TPA: CocE/NonD family hydrolase [Steroidobacteraceae bacterium]|nr:CocE/NonD family hydrolase [Steroidobacteraceae bacterium]
MRQRILQAAALTLVLVLLDSRTQVAAQATLASEMPSTFTPRTDSFDFERREVMIPMRDGVKLHTVILVPRSAKRAPILMTRTPYSADVFTNHNHSGRLAAVLEGVDNPTDVIVQSGYIRVIQDVRGKYKSEGDYVMNRPMRGALNQTRVDHSTDTYDTIEWLVRNVPESNGKVGIIGTSYDGFLTLAAMVDPHPALKVVVPMNPMVDGWRGDDWFHYGALRQEMMLPYVYDQEATRANDQKWWSSFHDDYDLFMDGVSAGEIARRHGMDQLGFYVKLTQHPAYDAFWQQQAMDRLLAGHPLSVPVMLVDGLWDQEDIYGAIAVYRALKPLDTRNDKIFMVIGPWYHGQQIFDPNGAELGKLRFGTDTTRYFRLHVLRPFLDHYLKDGAPAEAVATVTAFETGVNRWQEMRGWPAGCTGSCSPKLTPVYLQSGHGLAFDVPAESGYEEYVSDPAKPVPFRARPIEPYGGPHWHDWLVDDQREASGRTDVLTFVSDVLATPLSVSGLPEVNLLASTSGTDGDFVVKVIDVYPAEYPQQPEMGGYQLPVSMDIFRGRYRESLEKAQSLQPNVPLTYHFGLPAVNHTFLPGHRIMVQIQSSWFPLYDRNPQTFVDNIFFAAAADYRKANIRVYYGGKNGSSVELPVVVTKGVGRSEKAAD